MNDESQSPEASRHFIQQIIDGDLAAGKNDSQVVTRFPPEPNGYLHIGHAKSICLNFGLAAEYKGRCHLRFDDTNPANENEEFAESIIEAVRWLGFDWGEHHYFASDYFEKLYDYACELIRREKAYVCELGVEEFKEYRGIPTEPGKESPGRSRSVEENLDLFTRMRAGEFEDGAYVLRARIDMSSPNLHMRDPAVYRIKRAHHYRCGDDWCIYPMYDFAHCVSDALEGITHSLCTLEFEVHRPLYDWFLEVLEIEPHPQQIEFARLNLSYTVMSKRKLQTLVTEGDVSGWDDPRMPTLFGLRRRGIPPAAIRQFCERVGITKFDSLSDVGLLDFCVREELNKTAPRVMAVLDPLKVVITNYPEDETDSFEAIVNPEDPDGGTRQVPFSREVYIERADFMEDPPKKFFRLAPGREVRLRAACLVTCEDVIKDADGNVIEVHCRWDPETRGGSTPDGRKVKGTLHWVSAKHAVACEVRLYDRLFEVESPDGDKDKDFREFLNPDSLQTVQGYIEPSAAEAEGGTVYQFERLGYFVVDSVDSKPGQLVFNRTIGLRDNWAKKGKS